LGIPAGGVSYPLKVVRGGKAVATWVVDRSTAVVRKIGEVTMSIVENAVNLYGDTVDASSDWASSVGNTTPAVLGIPGFAGVVSPQPAWALQVVLRTTAAAVSPSRSAGLRNLPAGAGNGPGNPAYVWLPVEVPPAATTMAFEFTVTGNTGQDRIVAGIDTNNLLNLPAWTLPSGTRRSSGPLPIQVWAGRRVDLFFGVAGGTSTNAQVQIDAIRFLGEAPSGAPLLNVRREGDQVVLSWVDAEAQYDLEMSQDLAMPTWAPVAGVIQTPDGKSVTVRLSNARAFYRLRQR